MMIRQSYCKYLFSVRARCARCHCKIELIENFPCNDAEELKNRKKEIYDKLTEK